jgi:hypothetical protein
LAPEINFSIAELLYHSNCQHSKKAGISNLQFIITNAFVSIISNSICFNSTHEYNKMPGTTSSPSQQPLEQSCNNDQPSDSSIDLLNIDKNEE